MREMLLFCHWRSASDSVSLVFLMAMFHFPFASKKTKYRGVLSAMTESSQQSRNSSSSRENTKLHSTERERESVNTWSHRFRKQVHSLPWNLLWGVVFALLLFLVIKLEKPPGLEVKRRRSRVFFEICLSCVLASVLILLLRFTVAPCLSCQKPTR